MPFHRALLARGPDGTKGRVVYSKANRDPFAISIPLVLKNAPLSPTICLPTTLNPDEPKSVVADWEHVDGTLDPDFTPAWIEDPVERDSRNPKSCDQRSGNKLGIMLPRQVPLRHQS